MKSLKELSARVLLRSDLCLKKGSKKEAIAALPLPETVKVYLAEIDKKFADEVMNADDLMNAHEWALIAQVMEKFHLQH